MSGYQFNDNDSLAARTLDIIDSPRRYVNFLMLSPLEES